MMEAQTNKFVADVNPCLSQFTVDPNAPGDHLCHNMVRNQSSGTLKLLWKREDVILPDMWEPTVCDNNQCWATFVKQCPSDYYNELKKGTTMLSDVHIYDAGISGEAYIKLKVYELDDTSSFINIDYLFNKQNVGTKNVRNIAVRMYPNPANATLNIDYNNGISRIEIYNLLGSKVLNYKSEPSKSYDIGMLEDGMYFVKFITTDEKVMKTLRLQKRSVRP